MYRIWELFYDATPAKVINYIKMILLNKILRKIIPWTLEDWDYIAKEKTRKLNNLFYNLIKTHNEHNR